MRPRADILVSLLEKYSDRVYNCMYRPGVRVLPGQGALRGAHLVAGVGHWAGARTHGHLYGAGHPLLALQVRGWNTELHK